MNETNKDLGDRVKEALLRDTRSAGVDIQARAVNGKVTLTGIVDVLAEKQAAEEIAREVPGVAEVENSITVSTDGAIDDGEIQETLTRRLADEGLGVGAEVHKGNAELLGTAEDQEEKEQAIEVAQSTRGVKGIMDRVEVEEE